MELSYQETMQRITEYEKKFNKRIYCREKNFPFRIHIYKGENQFIIVPLITTIVGYSAEMAWYRQISELENSLLLGETVLQAIQHIEQSPVDARTELEREQDSILKNATHCHSYSELDKKYLYCTVILNDNKTILIYPGGHHEKREVYPGEKNQILLSPESSAKEIGEKLSECFKNMELFYELKRKK